VDVLFTRKERNPDKGATGDIVVTEVILSNIRVLAIDQAPKEKEGQNSVVGRTVTLELKPEQVPVLARSRQAGSLSLALRSIADANQVEVADDSVRSTSSINVVRYGVTNATTIQK
jgi:pilus assembly protein CpaB